MAFIGGKMFWGALIGINAGLFIFTSVETSNEQAYMEYSQEAAWASDRYFNAKRNGASTDHIETLEKEMITLEEKRDSYY